ncbi:hypothetical protein BHM03_00009882 [Ensete ventricosum]|nr:hypothetical protein BHM03_00009882 [Ensete ventricosum]
MQQSAAFKILRTRLKTVPSYSCIEQLKGTSSENPYSQILQFSEDNRNQYAANVANVYNAIDFPSKLQQFEKMQHKHRMHSKSKLQSRNSTPSIASQEINISEESRPPSPLPEIMQPPKSWNNPRQLKP